MVSLFCNVVWSSLIDRNSQKISVISPLIYNIRKLVLGGKGGRGEEEKGGRREGKSVSALTGGRGSKLTKSGRIYFMDDLPPPGKCTKLVLKLLAAKNSLSISVFFTVLFLNIILLQFT